MWATPTMKSISIHALREEGDDHGFEIQPEAAIFLSTPSARRATPHRLGVVQGQPISIHALREEGDLELYGVPAANIRFLSTPSARRATFGRSWTVTALSYFYPRPPRGGRRLRAAVTPLVRGDFYPRPPRGGRLAQSAQRSSVMRFLSTPSARRATRAIHGGETFQWNFYPRPPRGGRPGMPRPLRTVCGISIHALREEGDSRHAVPSLALGISIHALREEGDDCNAWSHGVAIGISIHALREEGDHVLAPAHSK